MSQTFLYLITHKFTLVEVLTYNILTSFQIVIKYSKSTHVAESYILTYEKGGGYSLQILLAWHWSILMSHTLINKCLRHHATMFILDMSPHKRKFLQFILSVNHWGGLAIREKIRGEEMGLIVDAMFCFNIDLCWFLTHW